MKTVLVLSMLLCAALAAPAEDKEKAADAAVDSLKEETAAAPAPQSENQQEEASSLDTRASCPIGWNSYGSYCFKYFDLRMSWYRAEEYCNDQGAHLASATDRNENNYLQQILRAHHCNNAWLGGFNLQGEWLWIDRQGFHFTKWNSGYSASRKPCIYLNSAGGWVDYHCNAAIGFICSKTPYNC